MTWLVDAHVHYHARFGWSRFLAGALANLDRAVAAETSGEAIAGCLLFVNQLGERTLDHLHREWTDLSGLHDGRSHGWTLLPTEEETAFRLERPDGPPLLLVQGWQIATREGLEVLALSCDQRIPDGLAFGQAVEASLRANAVTVIPWGFGKWWRQRGRIVSRLLDGDLADQIHLGDNGNRPRTGPAPRLFRMARDRDILILPGSDPLPFAHHVRGGLSYGFRLAGHLDPQRPGTSIRDRLQELRADPSTFGRRCSLPRFVTDQIRMQFRVRVGGRSRHASDSSRSETP